MNKPYKYLLLPISSIFFICLNLFCLAENLSHDFKYGLSVYKKGNCMGCHSWDGKGGGGYGGGAGVSLRKSDLTYDEIVNIVKCGRPGTGMPYFFKASYLKEKCYDTDISDYNENFRPISSKTYLNMRQIKAVSAFVKNILIGKSLDKNYCENFFKKGSRVCEKLN